MTMYSGPKQTPQQFHEQKEAALKVLIASSPSASPEQFNTFVQNYKMDFLRRFGRAPSARTTIPLFMEAGDYYIKRYTDKLQTLKNDRTKSLVDLATLMDSFIADFPDGSKSLIHYQNTPELALFSKELHVALTNKYGRPGFFNMMKNGRCAEASLLQSLAMLPIAISTPVSVKATAPRKSTRQISSASSSSSHQPTLTTELTSYGEIIAEFINRAAIFFDKTKSIPGKHLTMTAAALSHFDIEAFKTIEMTNHPIMPEAFVANRPIEYFVASCLKKLNHTRNPDVIIRAMHAIILVSPSTDLKKYLTEDRAKQFLNDIDSAIAQAPFDLSSPEDRALVNQLLFIKNTYPDVFPARLEQVMTPFVKRSQQQTHGSAFEVQIHHDILEATTELAKQYPGLIDRKKFNFNNPISAALGLESDVAYEDGEIKVCGQIDGEKYHRYLGSGRETQRTKLRDHCFLSQAWKLVKFSDSVKGVPYAIAQLKENIVIPAFEIKTAENISAVQNVARKLTEAHQELASLTIDDKMSALRDLQQQATQAIAAGNTLRGDDKTRVVGDLTALKRDLFELQAAIEMQQNSVNHELPKQLHGLQTELENFDYNAAECLTRFSNQTAMLQSSLAAKQSEVTKCKADLQSTEALIGQYEHTLASQGNLDSDKTALVTLEARRDELNQQLGKYKTLKNASVAELKKAGVTRKSLSEELIPGLEEQVATIERQVQLQSSTLKKDSSTAVMARGELDKAIAKKAELVKRKTHIKAELSAIRSQLDYFEMQLTAPVMGTALLANNERMLQTLIHAKQAQLDIATTLATVTKTLTDSNEFIAAKAAAITIAKASTLKVTAKDFTPAPKMSTPVPPQGMGYYHHPEVMPNFYPSYSMYPAYGYGGYGYNMYPQGGVVTPFPGYYQQPIAVHSPVADSTAPSTTLLHAFPKKLADDRQQELLSKAQSSREVVKNATVEKPAIKVN